jgi:UDP-N-acetylmuramoylalanine--D-glutamate ligase
MTVLVIGLGVSGRAAVDLLNSQGERVIGYDARPESASGVDADEIRTGPWKRDLLDGIDLVVPSPGVAETSDVMADVLASGIPVWSELELGFRALEGKPVVAVTGTNGKTTVTELTAAMLLASGIDAVAVGNIGDPISGTGVADHDVLVVEASSFQLRFIDRFRPNAAVIINFAPDHLDWHPDVAAYGAAKARSTHGRVGSRRRRGEPGRCERVAGGSRPSRSRDAGRSRCSRRGRSGAWCE